jgi:hypothetical protein
LRGRLRSIAGARQNSGKAVVTPLEPFGSFVVFEKKLVAVEES